MNQKYLAVFLVLLLIPIPSSYAFVQFNHINIFCEQSITLDDTNFYKFIKICPFTSEFVFAPATEEPVSTVGTPEGFEFVEDAECLSLGNCPLEEIFFVEFVPILPSEEQTEEELTEFQQLYPLTLWMLDEFSGKKFHLISSTPSVDIGEVAPAGLWLGWSNERNLIVSKIIFADSQFGIQVINVPPVQYLGGASPDNSKLMNLGLIDPSDMPPTSSVLINYEIITPMNGCSTEIMEGCVEFGTHKIPIKVTTIQDGIPIVLNTRVEISVGTEPSLIDFELLMIIVLALLLALIFLIIFRRKEKKKQ